MIKLDAGNVLLKRSQRRQLMAWLRRPMRLGEKLGDFGLTLTMARVGHRYDVRASVRDSAGAFDTHCRKSDWRNAIRDTARSLSLGLHQQNLQRAE